MWDKCEHKKESEEESVNKEKKRKRCTRGVTSGVIGCGDRGIVEKEGK